ncbi:transketolase, partial [Vibrio cholerae HC-59B1]
RHLR